MASFCAVKNLLSLSLFLPDTADYRKIMYHTYVSVCMIMYLSCLYTCLLIFHWLFIVELIQ